MKKVSYSLSFTSFLDKIAAALESEKCVDICHDLRLNGPPAARRVDLRITRTSKSGEPHDR
jgi:hypothetical protein